MRVDRRVLIGGAALVGFVAVVHALTQDPAGRARRRGDARRYRHARPGSWRRSLLTCLAFRRNAGEPVSLDLGCFSALWLAANLFADMRLGLVRSGAARPSPPSPSVADVGYLISYPLAFLTVVFAAWKAPAVCGRWKAGLDAMMFTLGSAGSGVAAVAGADAGVFGAGAQRHVISLAYPLGDLLVIMAFASLLLGSFQQRPPRFLVVIWVAFVVQVVADSIYFVQMMAPAGRYTVRRAARLALGSRVRPCRQ